MTAMTDMNTNDRYQAAGKATSAAQRESLMTGLRPVYEANTTAPIDCKAATSTFSMERNRRSMASTSTFGRAR